MDPGAPARPPPPDPDVERLAEALDMPPERVARALDAAGLSPAALRATSAGEVRGERLEAVARALRVEAPRLRAALLDIATSSAAFAGQAATATDAALAAVRGTAEEALAIGLEIVGESVPKLLNNLLAGLAAAGVALVALGLLAIFQTELFVRLLAIIAGIALVAAGAAFFVLAWRLHEATSALRMLARVAKRWRARHAAAAPGSAAAPQGPEG